MNLAFIQANLKLLGIGAAIGFAIGVWAGYQLKKNLVEQRGQK